MSAAKVLTANLLKGGDVVYWSSAGDWSTTLADALILASAEQGEAALEAAEQAGGEIVVVGPYLMDVALEDGRILPVSQREIIRAKGPTVHPQFAKSENAHA